MKQWLASLLRRWAEWLAPLPPAIPLAVLIASRLVVREVDKTPHTSAYKRALAMKALMRQFPDTARRDLAMGIEVAVRDL